MVLTPVALDLKEIVGLAAVIAGPTLAVLGYRRARQVDATSAQSGVATESRAGTSQIIDGLNSLIDNLQEDNGNFRTDLKALTLRLDECAKERETFRRELAMLRRRYGENGDGKPPS